VHVVHTTCSTRPGWQAADDYSSLETASYKLKVFSTEASLYDVLCSVLEVESTIGSRISNLNVD
jgi:hypothetical protein